MNGEKREKLFRFGLRLDSTTHKRAYFVSKSVAEAERGKRVSFEQYVGLFFLLCLFPVGIWVIQPKINRLQRGAGSPEVG